MNPWVFEDAISSVSLSHVETCGCLTCRAAGGDRAAWAQLYVALADAEGSALAKLIPESVGGEGQ